MKVANLDVICRFVGAASGRTSRATLRNAAKQCFVDWFAVSLAALTDAGPSVVRRQMRQWATHGQAINLYGDTGAAGPMALVNGTLSHSLDYDDMHFDSACHISGPTIAAALAVGMDRGCSEEEVLDAFVTGYEVAATMGVHGIGPKLAGAGWHPTGVLGHFSAASAAAALLRLDAGQIANALGLAATQAAGLQASGGSMAKPFHVGKAAMNGVMAAELAGAGMDSNTSLVDDPLGGVLAILFQQPQLASFDEIGREWQIEGNTFKPYAACQLTHAAYEAARGMSSGFLRRGLREIRVYVHPLAPKVANRLRAATPMEGKFSIPYCVGLGLLGYGADIGGFIERRLADTDLRGLAEMTRVIPSVDVERWAARVETEHVDGAIRQGETSAVRGSPGRPLTWSDLDEKFLTAVTPVLGDDAPRLLEALHCFDEPGRLADIFSIIRRSSQSVPNIETPANPDVIQER